MVKDLFERIQNNKGPLGKWASQAEGYYVFPKLEGELGPRMQFHGKEILNWSINDYLGLAIHPEVRKADTERQKSKPKRRIEPQIVAPESQPSVRAEREKTTVQARTVVVESELRDERLRAESSRADDLAERLSRLERQHEELKAVAIEVEGRLERAMEYIRSLLAADQK